ncbi:hypothetical protein MMC22_001533 [Lobaria immixta]|nr:hypothetical protein [Lobaria immixta]
MKRSTKLSSPDSYDSLRQRVLRLPLPPTYKSRQTSSQSQCPIFTIPPEIRRIIWIGYSEAIEILYSRNVLDLDTDHLLTLPELLIPPHFNAIRFLNITLPLEEKCSMFVEVFFERFSEDVRDWLRVPWLDVWENIASMEGLRELHVQMTVPLRRRSDWVRDQISLLEPLKVVTRPKVFLLTLPFRDPAEDESFLQELPCQIQRAPQAIDG